MFIYIYIYIYVYIYIYIYICFYVFFAYITLKKGLKDLVIGMIYETQAVEEKKKKGNYHTFLCLLPH